MKFARVINGYEHLLDKLNKCKAFLKANGVFDRGSFIDLNKED